MAMPGSSHTGYYMISYEFVYVGNTHGGFWQTHQVGEHYSDHAVLCSSQHADYVRTVLDIGQRFCICHQPDAVCRVAKGK